MSICLLAWLTLLSHRRDTSQVIRAASQIRARRQKIRTVKGFLVFRRGTCGTLLVHPPLISLSFCYSLAWLFHTLLLCWWHPTIHVITPIWHSCIISWQISRSGCQGATYSSTWTILSLCCGIGCWLSWDHMGNVEPGFEPGWGTVYLSSIGNVMGLITGHNSVSKQHTPTLLILTLFVKPQFSPPDVFPYRCCDLIFQKNLLKYSFLCSASFRNQT